MGQGQGSSLDTMLKGYEPAIPDITQSYLKNLGGNLVDLPSFQEMYQSYKDVAQRQAGEAGAAITESFGSQGGRYSSDLLKAQSTNQSNLAADLRNAASQYALGLRGQQFQEISGATNYLSNRDVLGQQYLWQDFLRQTSPPPLLGAAASAPGSPPSSIPF